MQMSLRQVLNATKELQASVALPKNAPVRAYPPTPHDPCSRCMCVRPLTTTHVTHPNKPKQIRVLSLGLNTSAEPLNDVEEALLPWSVASPEVRIRPHQMIHRPLVGST